MAEGTPRFVHYSEAAKNFVMLIAALGALIVFLLWDRPARNVELERELAEAKLATQKAELRHLDAQLQWDNARREKALATVAEAEAVRDTTPLLTVRPEIQQSSAFKDVREIRVEPHFENKGKVDVQIEGVVVEVYQGQPKERMAATIDRTNEMFSLNSYLQPLGGGPPADEQQMQAMNRYNELSKQCPHGSIFFVGPGSPDIEWTKLDDLTQNRRTNIKLQPAQEAFESFVYVVTEGHKPNTGWFKFGVTVNSNKQERQQFEFVIPIYRVGAQSYMTNTVARPEVESSWQPSGSLLPIVPAKAQ